MSAFADPMSSSAVSPAGTAPSSAVVEGASIASGNPPLGGAPADDAPEKNASSPKTLPGEGESVPAPQGDQPPASSPTESEEIFSKSPFTSYGEVNESQDEQQDLYFYQYGRLFGVSLGLGGEFVSGNRGALWQGGVPLVDVKLHCWFDFNVALAVGIYTAQHFYNTTAQSLGYVSVNMIHIGVDLKYYVDTRNLSSTISFANPYFLLGAGSYSKAENSVTANYQNTDNSLAIALGGGLEFVVVDKKIYFELEGKVNFVTFQDTYTTSFQGVGLTNLTGQFMTLSGSFLFTW